MSTKKRMLLAFCSMLLAITVLLTVSTVSQVARYGTRYLTSGLELFPVFLMLAFPGWVLALPFVLFFKNAAGSHGWAILGIGTAIGPAFMFGWARLASYGPFTWERDGLGVVLALPIGFLTTLFYVFLLRRLYDPTWTKPKPVTLSINPNVS